MKPKTSYVYGPAPSRRLGFSLGIDIIPHKTCNFDCIYCQLGHTVSSAIKRKEYVPAYLVLRQVKAFLRHKIQIDHITFSGSGEPTFNSRLGYLIKEIKKITRIPVAVLTNGSLLYRADVQKDLLQADIVLPTLCAATDDTFRKVHGRHVSLTVEKIIKGQAEFRRIYKGKIWLEIMLIKNVNDSARDINALKKAVARIKPDKIQLNTVVRPPSKKSASPLTISRLKKIRCIFGHNCEIIPDFGTRKKTIPSDRKEEAAYSLIARRPVTQEEISRAIGLSIVKTKQCLNNLQRRKKIKLRKHGGKEFYEVR